MPINLRDIAERRSDLDFEYQGQPVHIAFRTDKLTREFRAEAMRLNRDVLKMERRQAVLLEHATLVTAEDGTPEAVFEDEQAEAAIKELMEQGDILKREIDHLIQTILIEWDLLLDDGQPVPFTDEALFEVPAIFEGAILSVILAQGNQGEAPGAMPSNNLPLPLRQRDKPETSRPSQNGIHSSKPADIVQP